MPDDIFSNVPPKAEELGEPLAYYRDRPGLSRLLTLLRVMTRLAVGGVFVALGLRARADPAASDALSVALLVLSSFAAAVCLLSAVRIGWRGLHLRLGSARGVVRYPRGLVCVLADKRVLAPWDEIDWVWDGGLRFRIRAGAEVTLPETMEGVPTLVRLLYQETFQRLSVCASAAILGGRAVEFGPVTLTREEIAAGDRRVAWAEVGDVDLARGRFRVVQQGEQTPALDVSVREIPNLHALWALVVRLRENDFGSIVIGPKEPEPPEIE